MIYCYQIFSCSGTERSASKNLRFLPTQSRIHQATTTLIDYMALRARIPSIHPCTRLLIVVAFMSGRTREPHPTESRHNEQPKRRWRHGGHTGAMPEKTCTADQVEVMEINERGRTASKELRNANEAARCSGRAGRSWRCSSGRGDGDSEMASLVLVDELQHRADATDQSGGGTRSVLGCRVSRRR